MGVIRITLPRLGETMEEARVTEWLKAPGEAFRRGDVLLEVETDKTVVEVPALQDGRLVAHLVAPGEMVALEQPIAEVEVKGTAEAPVSAPAASDAEIGPAAVLARAPVREGSAQGGRASPLARRLARQAGLDLAQIAGSGRRGRVMGDDVRAVLASAPANSAEGPLAVRRLAVTGNPQTPVVLLHGLYDEGRGWRDLPDRLVRAGHPVIVPDLPGHGQSRILATSVEDAAQMLGAVLPEGPVILAGHSVGAILAVRLAERLGARVEHLVLIAPAGLGARINRDFLDLMAAAETPDVLARAMALLGGGPVSPAGLRAELDRLRPLRAGLGPLVRSVARDGIQQVDIAPLLERIAAPVTAVFGLEDRIVDWRDCANLPASVAIHLVRGAGHLPHATAAERLAALILKRDPMERRQVNATTG